MAGGGGQKRFDLWRGCISLFNNDPNHLMQNGARSPADILGSNGIIAAGLETEKIRFIERLYIIVQ